MPHINELIDFTVGCYIVHQSRVLLINHKQLKRWLCPGGHIELDEDPEQALFREIEEETGIKPENLTLATSKPNLTSPGSKFLPAPSYLDIHDINATHKHVGLFYFAQSNTDQIKLAETEHDGIRWFSKNDLSDQTYNLSPAVKYYAEQAIAHFTSFSAN